MQAHSEHFEVAETDIAAGSVAAAGLCPVNDPEADLAGVLPGALGLFCRKILRCRIREGGRTAGTADVGLGRFCCSTGLI